MRVALSSQAYHPCSVIWCPLRGLLVLCRARCFEKHVRTLTTVVFGNSLCLSSGMHLHTTSLSSIALRSVWARRSSVVQWSKLARQTQTERLSLATIFTIGSKLPVRMKRRSGWREYKRPFLETLSLKSFKKDDKECLLKARLVYSRTDKTTPISLAYIILVAYECFHSHSPFLIPTPCTLCLCPHSQFHTLNQSRQFLKITWLVTAWRRMIVPKHFSNLWLLLTYHHRQANCLSYQQFFVHLPLHTHIQSCIHYVELTTVTLHMHYIDNNPFYCFIH